MNHSPGCIRVMYGCDDVSCKDHECTCLKAPYDLNIDAIAKRGGIMSAILDERNRQDTLKASGKFKFTCADAIPDGDKYIIFGEEAGEVARAIHDENWENLRDELTQCAAICLAWLEAL